MPISSAIRIAHRPYVPPPPPSCSSTAHERYSRAQCSRRMMLLRHVGCVSFLSLGGAFVSPPLSDAASSPQAEGRKRERESDVHDTKELLALARRAYSKRNFDEAIMYIDQLVEMNPKDPTLLEMRATALVDAKRFGEAVLDFDRCLSALGTSAETMLDRARVVSGKGLALEGIDDFIGALSAYEKALNIAADAGADPDPYVQNSVGNCYASLGEWSRAREYFQMATRGFQIARREGNVAGTLLQRSEGAVLSASNAALMLAQLGDVQGAMKEMKTIVRRAPGNADMRAGLVALLWDMGQEAQAEEQWAFACDNIDVGCSRYQNDQEWLRRVRRWPPAMIEKLQAFLAVRSVKSRSSKDSLNKRKEAVR